MSEFVFHFSPSCCLWWCHCWWFFWGGLGKGEERKAANDEKTKKKTVVVWRSLPRCKRLICIVPLRLIGRMLLGLRCEGWLEDGVYAGYELYVESQCIIGN